jgi:hypothetical protein
MKDGRNRWGRIYVDENRWLSNWRCARRWSWDSNAYQIHRKICSKQCGNAEWACWSKVCKINIIEIALGYYPW